MDFSSVLKTRHSVRHFKSTPIDKDILLDILRDAQTSPSWVNAQEYRVWLVTGKKLECIRDEYRCMTQKGIKGYSDLPVAHRTSWSLQAQENMKQFSEARIQAGLLEEKELSQSYLFHAPAVMYLTLPKQHSEWALLDLGVFEQTLLLAATSRGIGTVPAYNLVKYPDVLRNHLSIPENERIIIGIALGFEEDTRLNKHRSIRQPIENIVTIVE